MPLRILFFLVLRLRAYHRDLILEITLKADFSEAPLVHGIWSYFKPAKDRFYLLALSLASALAAVEQKQIRIKRIRLTIEPNNLGWAQAWELRDILRRFGQAGVPVSAYLLADDRISAFIASAAERIACPETSTFDFSHFTSESIFLQNFLARLGVRPQFMAVGDFKSAAEIFTRSGMSPAARRQSEELIADMERTFFAALAEKAAHFTSTKKYGIYTASQAQATGFIDATMSYSEFIEMEGGTTTRTVDLYTVDKLIWRKTWQPLRFRRPRRIAIVVAEGNIVESAESRPGSINWADYSAVAENLRDGKFSALLLRINSPGGSAQISQLLWREWMLATGRLEGATIATEEKSQSSAKKNSQSKTEAMPVFVSQGNVAASGGYYLSAIGDKIFAAPNSITGSIGVIGGKFNVAPLLNKWGITVDRAPKKHGAPAFSAFADFGPEHKKTIQASMQEVYRQFLRDIAVGRRKDVRQIEPHASGRVFSGQKAQQIALADAPGGVSHALQALREQLAMKPLEPVELVVLPSVRESLFNRSLLPFGLSRLASLADFTHPGIYALDTRFLTF